MEALGCTDEAKVQRDLLAEALGLGDVGFGSAQPTADVRQHPLGSAPLTQRAEESFPEHQSSPFPERSRRERGV